MDNNQWIDVAYGKESVPLQARREAADWEVIRPTFESGLSDPASQFQEACRHPIGSEPLEALVAPSDDVLIITSDATRPVPNEVLIPWILEELPVPTEQVTVLLGNGTHRPNTPEELEEMFGADIAREVTILNHDAFDEDKNELVGTSDSGTEVWLNERYLEADVRIVVGFIEPHFFAGFSGGAKGVAPGIAGIETIFRFHRADIIGHPRSTYGILEDNPVRQEVLDAVALAPPEFMVNVTLNYDKEITGFYVGDYYEAHLEGCRAVKASSMAAVPDHFPIVVTSNSGYPLDRNLYQAVKGVSAAARIVEEGGTIFLASECRNGLPDHGNFGKLMQEGDTPQDVLDAVYEMEPILDQWQAQTLATILQRADVAVHAALDADVLQSCKLDVVEDLNEAVHERISALNGSARVAVLPDGPLTIPYVHSPS